MTAQRRAIKTARPARTGHDRIEALAGANSTAGGAEQSERAQEAGRRDWESSFHRQKPKAWD